MPISGSYVFCGEKKLFLSFDFLKLNLIFQNGPRLLKRITVNNLFFVKLSIMSYLLLLCAF